VIAVGLMSGTSLNGIDAALVRIVPAGDRYAIELLAFRTEPFGMELERKLRRALPPASATAGRLAELHRGLGRAFARAARAIVGKGPVGYVASHGQTIWHDGERGVTLQLGDPFAIRQAVEATVCYDFRSADCAEGGHGAPLVPYVDALLFADRSEDRVMLNLGGIANVTLIPRGASCGDVVAFDTGPANMLIDALVRERTNARESFDRDGALALAGAVDRAVLERMLSDEYFARPAPKIRTSLDAGCSGDA
jgi:anhydro-N-acetylmuramic acid kinase